MDTISRHTVKTSPPQKTSQATAMMYQEPDSQSPDKLDQVSFEENYLLTIKALWDTGVTEMEVIDMPTEPLMSQSPRSCQRALLPVPC